MPSPTTSLPPIPTESRCNSQPWFDFDTAGMTGRVCAIPWPPATVNITACCEGKWRLHDCLQICEVPDGFDFIECVNEARNLRNESMTGFVTGTCTNASDVQMDAGGNETRSGTAAGEWELICRWILRWRSTFHCLPSPDDLCSSIRVTVYRKEIRSAFPRHLFRCVWLRTLMSCCGTTSRFLTIRGMESVCI